MRIDWWTLALQTVNVLILIWILARFFFRPVMDIVNKRQAEANKLLSDAAHARQEAAHVRRDADKARGEIAAERQRLLAEVHDATQIEKQKLIAQSADEIAKLHAEAKAAIARERSAAEAAIIDRASDLSVEIARRLLARFPQKDIFYVFVDEICRELRALSPEARESIGSAAAAGQAIDVVTAAPLSKEETRHVRDAVTEAFGRELPIEFRCDPAIISGIELKGPNAIILNSWRANLDRIRQELSRDKHARQS